jgi:two-component system CheB/CheR fusion protein
MAEELPDELALRVVVIDDDHQANAALVRLLASAGFQVLGSAYDGLAGLKLIKDARPDAVIVDIEMPGMDGFELASRVRNEVDSPPHVIAISGCNQKSIGEKLNCFDAYFCKPADWERLESLLVQYAQSISV